MDTETEVYEKYAKFLGIMLEEHDPLEVAAVMVIQGLGLYKTCMDDYEFNEIVKTVYERRDSIRGFNE